MTKFTKGPWHVSDPNHDETGCYGISDGEYILADLCSDIANSGYDQKANAALIAAAPELYEALQEFVDSFGEAANFPIIKKARAALAKAEGGVK